MANIILGAILLACVGGVRVTPKRHSEPQTLQGNTGDLAAEEKPLQHQEHAAESLLQADHLRGDSLFIGRRRRPAGAYEADAGTAVNPKACIRHWGQCGGHGYRGATCCRTGLVCNRINSFSSQCRTQVGVAGAEKKAVTVYLEAAKTNKTVANAGKGVILLGAHLGSSGGWTNDYNGDNELNIVPAARRSDNYILIIGDWGCRRNIWNHYTGGCQDAVAKKMKEYVQNMKNQGKKCLLIAAVGDNFYDTGMKSTSDWKAFWGDVYGTNDPKSPLYGIPWMGILGNHDIGDGDPWAACPDKSPNPFAVKNGQKYAMKQFNSDKNPSRPAWTNGKYWQPDYNWHYLIKEAGLEVIGVDTNVFDVNGVGGGGASAGGKQVWKNCGGAPRSFLEKIKASGFELIRQRAAKSPAKTVLIIQHYNGAMASDVKSEFEKLNGGKAQVLSAYGHAHEQKCERGPESKCQLILTGGGGGWGGPSYGFTAVHLTDDGGYTTKINSNRVSGCKI